MNVLVEACSREREAWDPQLAWVPQLLVKSDLMDN